MAATNALFFGFLSFEIGLAWTWKAAFDLLEGSRDLDCVWHEARKVVFEVVLRGAGVLLDARPRLGGTDDQDYVTDCKLRGFLDNTIQVAGPDERFVANE